MTVRVHLEYRVSRQCQSLLEIHLIIAWGAVHIFDQFQLNLSLVKTSFVMMQCPANGPGSDNYSICGYSFNVIFDS